MIGLFLEDNDSKSSCSSETSSLFLSLGDLLMDVTIMLELGKLVLGLYLYVGDAVVTTRAALLGDEGKDAELLLTLSGLSSG